MKEIDDIIKQILVTKLKPFDVLKDINAQCIDTGNTALIFAAVIGEVVLVKRLLARGANPALRNLDGANAFRWAIYGNHEEVIQALLPFETPESLNYVDRGGNTALSLAASLELTIVERTIMKKGGVIPGFKIEGLKTPSQTRRDFLRSLEQDGPLLQDYSSVPKSMFVNFFVDNKDIRFPMDYLEYLFLNPNFRILMTLVIQASRYNQSKHFFFNYKFHEAMLFSGNAKNRENIKGYINYKTKEIYCFYKDDISIETFTTFFHEGMHLVMDFVYKNNANPYAKEDSEKKERFAKILDQTKDKLETLQPKSLLERSAHNSLWAVYDVHLRHEMASELIVRIPEILICMGIERGMKWLGQFKELMAYYEAVVMPDMQAQCKSIVHEEGSIVLTPFHTIMQLIYERKFWFCTAIEGTAEMKLCEELTPEEFIRMKETMLFFQYDSELIKKFEIHVRNTKVRKLFISVEWENRIHLSVASLEKLAKELTQLKGSSGLIKSFERYIQNRRVLDEFFLDSNNKIHLQYWSEQVIGFGGCDYNGYRIPHTVANIFKVLEQESAVDGPVEEMLEKIHETRKKPSGSRMSFFGRSMAVEELRTMQDEAFLLSFSPGNSCHSM